MITEPLRKVIAGEEANNTQGAEDYRDLSKAAEQWAAHSLRTYSGKTLKRALAISHALAQFTAIIEPRQEDASKRVTRNGGMK